MSPWLTGNRVLVTGASGFIGQHLCRSLADAGAEVHGSARRRHPELPDGMAWHEADLQHGPAADEIIARVKPHVVYHLAGAVTGVRDVEQVVPVFNATLVTTVHVLTAAWRHGVGRVVLAGSMEEPSPDDPVPIPSSPYAAAKWASGGYGRMFASLYGLGVVELRVFMTYGPGFQPADKLVPALVLGILRGEPPTLGSGSRRVDWVYIDDVVDALLRASTAVVPVGRHLDVGSGTLVSVREFAERLARHVDPHATLRFGSRQDRQAEREAVADVETSRSLLGWEPRTDLDTGLARVVAWYRERYEAGDFDKT